MTTRRQGLTAATLLVGVLLVASSFVGTASAFGAPIITHATWSVSASTDSGTASLQIGQVAEAGTVTVTAQLTTEDYGSVAVDPTPLAPSNYRWRCADVTHSGTTTTLCADSTTAPTGWTIDRTATTVTFTQRWSVGPYQQCGTATVTNAVGFSAADELGVGTVPPEGPYGWHPQHGTASATVHVDVPCHTGCTATIGYWKNHSDGKKSNGKQADRLTALLPVWLGTGSGKSVNVTSGSQAVAILDKSNDASNGINKLYAQMLATKLNIKAGASSGAVAATIAAADAFLAQYDAADWATLTAAQQQTVLSWATTFDQFNNGLIGPGSCK